MFSVCVLASGSVGNSIYVSDRQTAILLDAGLSGIEIQRRMERRKLKVSSLSAIFVTHEHSDHIKGVGVLSRRFNLPVYINHSTRRVARLGTLYKSESFECGTTFNIGSFLIKPFSVSHDAVDPVGIVMVRGKIKIGVVTDLGIVTRLVQDNLTGCNLIVLEANHDLQMLLNGPYSWNLKQRVSGRKGHLSNVAAAELIKNICHKKLKHVILAHVSRENNTLGKAFNRVKAALSSCNATLNVASQEMGTDLFILK